MSGSAPAVLFAIAGGAAVAVQVGINADLGKRIGVLETIAFTALVTFAVLLPIVLVARRGIGGFADLSNTPPWLLTGGILGAVALGGLVFSPPAIGAFATLAIFLAAQLGLGFFIDAFGLFGAERTGVTVSRVAGLVLLAAGAVLVLRR